MIFCHNVMDRFEDFSPQAVLRALIGSRLGRRWPFSDVVGISGDGAPGRDTIPTKSGSRR